VEAVINRMLQYGIAHGFWRGDLFFYLHRWPGYRYERIWFELYHEVSSAIRSWPHSAVSDFEDRKELFVSRKLLSVAVDFAKLTDHKIARKRWCDMRLKEVSIKI